MASVNTKNSAFWHANIRQWFADAQAPKGGAWRRTWKSTGIPADRPKAEAQKVADAIETAAAAAHPDNPRRTDLRAFAEAMESIWKAAGIAPPTVSTSWRKFSAEFVAQADVGEKTRRLYRAQCQLFTDHLGAKSDAMLWSLTHEDCQAFYHSLIKAGRAVKTARNKLKTVQAVLTRAELLGIIPRNPAKLVSTPLGESAQRQPFTRGDISAIFAVLDHPPPEAVFLRKKAAEWRTAVMLGLYCGMRLGDALGRAWPDFDMEAGTVTFLPQKKSRRGRKVTLPLHGPLRARLAALPREGPWLTPLLRTQGKASDQFGKLILLAGITAEKSRDPARKDAGHTIRLKSFHSLRHTVLTELAKSGADKQLRQLLADHDDEKVNDRYTHAEVERLAAALRAAFPEAG